MIASVSLLPLAAAATSAFLFAVALPVRARSSSVRYFLGLNACTAAWSFGYFLAMNLPGCEPVLSPHGICWALLALMAVGTAGAPTCWFLFCASYARRPALTEGWRGLLVRLPFAYTLLITVTNPWHRLFVERVTSGKAPAYGPLAPTSQLTTFALIGAGIWLLVTSAWRRATRQGRRQAVLLGLASLTPMIGGMLWTLRYALHVPLAINPTPVLFPLLNLALGHQLFSTGLADIAPHAALQAFNSLTDPAIAVDPDHVIVAINDAAKRAFPALALGRGLEPVPELSNAAALCVGSDHAYTGFDLQVAGVLYWVRVRSTTDRRGAPAGCVVLLTDVTELRATQARIVELSRALGEDVVPPRSAPLVERREHRA